MKIIAIGDPHGDLKKVKKIPVRGVDLILITGDLGRADLMRKIAFENVERKRKGLKPVEYSLKQQEKAYMESFNSSLKIVKYLSKFAPVYTIYGNVESRGFEVKELESEIGVPLPRLTEELRKIKGVRVINNVIANFKGVRVGGVDYFIDTSWVREFKPSNYRDSMRGAKSQSDRVRRILRRFGKMDVDVIVHHQPPYGVLDKVGGNAPKDWKGKHAGSKVILDFIRKHQPKFSFCGHIHEGAGMKRVGRTEVYNLGVCGYKVVEF